MEDKERAANILEALNQEYPEADTRLSFSSIFELLVAVVLSAQSTDEQVNKVTQALFECCRTPEDLAAVDLTELESLIRGVGIYKNKARHLKALATAIARDYQGEVPCDFDELLKLPGVGRKTANVVMAVGFKQPGLGVDTHVKRVAARLGMARGKSALEIENGLKQAIPMHYWSKAHHLLIFHGRAVCKARKPLCGNCLLQAVCEQNLE